VVGSNDGLWEWDVHSDEMYVSPRAKDLLGYTDREIENTPAAFVSLIHPDDREGMFAAIKAHVRKGIPYDVEFRCRSKSSGYRWLRVRGRSVRDAAGHAVRLAGSVTDITDRRFTRAQQLSRSSRSPLQSRSSATRSSRLTSKAASPS
jgi:PAS domain S-box-containing protein